MPGLKAVLVTPSGGGARGGTLAPVPPARRAGRIGTLHWGGEWIFMTTTNRARDHWSRCGQRAAELRVLAVSEHGLTPPGQFAAEIREATNEIIAEVEAAGRTSLGVSPYEAGAETFFWVRVARLAMAADQAVDTARRGDRTALRAHLQHFDTLITAIWTVHNATYAGLGPIALR